MKTSLGTVLGFRSALSLMLPATLLLTGCGGGQDLAPLSGTVEFKGKPLEFGYVILKPTNGGPVARGEIQPDGTFEMSTDGKKGATVGSNSVRITCYTGQDPSKASATDGEGRVMLGKSVIPEDYSRFSSSQISVEVKPGENPPFPIKLVAY